MLPEATLVISAPLGLQAGVEEFEVIDTPQGAVIRDNVTGEDRPFPKLSDLLEKLKAFFIEGAEVVKGTLSRIEFTAEVGLIVVGAILAWNFSR